MADHVKKVFNVQWITPYLFGRLLWYQMYDDMSTVFIWVRYEKIEHSFNEKGMTHWAHDDAETLDSTSQQRRVPSGGPYKTIAIFVKP